MVCALVPNFILLVSLTAITRHTVNLHNLQSSLFSSALNDVPYFHMAYLLVSKRKGKSVPALP
jgi:hypothetical protein